MRITNELKEKITREVSKKFQKRRTELEKEYNAIRDNEKIRMTAIITQALEREPVLTILLEKYFSAVTIADRIDRFMIHNGVDTSVTADAMTKINDLKNEQSLFLENFLINVAYEKDIDGIKSLFGEFELSF